MQLRVAADRDEGLDGVHVDAGTADVDADAYVDADVDVDAGADVDAGTAPL